MLVLVTWFGVPLANLALMLHPLGRMALKPVEKRLALLVGLCVLGIGYSFVAYQVTQDYWYVILGLAVFFLLFPLMSWHAAPLGWIRWAMLAYLLGLFVLAASILTLIVVNPRGNVAQWWDIYRWGCILSTFVVQFFVFRSIVR